MSWPPIWPEWRFVLLPAGQEDRRALLTNPELQLRLSGLYQGAPTRSLARALVAARLGISVDRLSLGRRWKEPLGPPSNLPATSEPEREARRDS